MDTVTTSPSEDSSIDWDDPLGLNASPTQEDLEFREQLERARIRSVAVFSSSPLYQARAAKDPEYWNKFYVGGVR